MSNCTRFLRFLFVGFLALSIISCQTSHGSYGNTKHHKKSSSKSSSSKSSGTKSAPEKTTPEKPAAEPAEKGTSENGEGYKSNAQGNATGKKSPMEKRLGYGVNLGALQFSNSTFQFGLSPNIAYKLTDSWAAGFMLKIDFYSFKLYDGNLAYKYSSFGLGPTVFTRFKPLWKVEGATPFMKGLFLQGEYEHASISQPYDEYGNITVNGDKIVGVRRWEDYAYFGIGSSSGYPFSTFFSLHYNILDDINHSRVPWNWRLGFTWNY